MSDEKKPTGRPVAWVQFANHNTKAASNMSGTSALVAVDGLLLFARTIDGHMFICQDGKGKPEGAADFPIENCSAVGWK